MTGWSVAYAAAGCSVAASAASVDCAGLATVDRLRLVGADGDLDLVRLGAATGLGTVISSTPLSNVALIGVGVDALGQTQRPAEAAVAALDAVVALPAVARCSDLRSPETLRTLPSSSMLHVVLGQAREIGAQDVVRSRTRSGPSPAPSGASAARSRRVGVSNSVVEQPVHRDRLPANQCHVITPSVVLASN